MLFFFTFFLFFDSSYFFGGHFIRHSAGKVTFSLHFFSLVLFSLIFFLDLSSIFLFITNTYFFSLLFFLSFDASYFFWGGNFMSLRRQGHVFLFIFFLSSYFLSFSSSVCPLFLSCFFFFIFFLPFLRFGIFLGGGKFIRHSASKVTKIIYS